MILRANCKLNLHLKITGKLENGYHTLETVFSEIPFYDTIELTPISTGIEFESTGIPIPHDGKENICVRAAKSFFNEFDIEGGVKIRLKKEVFIGAGLGGGSSDAATVLRGLRSLYNSNISDDDLEKVGVKLGADVPFFIKGGTAYASGIGEELVSVKDMLCNKFLILIYPNIHISTKEVYTNCIFDLTNKKNDTILRHIKSKMLGLSDMDRLFENDMEKYVFEKYPEVKKCGDLLKKHGSEFVRMSGSGSTVFGIFNDEAIFSEAVNRLKDFETKNIIVKSVII